MKINSPFTENAIDFIWLRLFRKSSILVPLNGSIQNNLLLVQ